MVKREESSYGVPEIVYEYSHYTDEDVTDQLGTLPPGILVLASYPKFPYFPAYVMSGADAKRQQGLRREVSDLENGLSGCCVRFFASNTCAVLPATAIEPLIVNNKDYTDWIWRSSLTQQVVMGWPEYTKETQNLWARAFDDARVYAESNYRVFPEMVIQKQTLQQGRVYRKVGFLKPGTIVWTTLETHPIWPACVLKGKGRPNVSRGKSTSSDEATEPLSFIGDDVLDRPPMMTSTDNIMGFTADICWIEHMRARSLMSMEERGWKKTPKKDWDLWDRACETVFSRA